MKWIDALIDFNETKKNWIVPRKGTKAYIKVMKVVRPETAAETGNATCCSLGENPGKKKFF